MKVKLKRLPIENEKWKWIKILENSRETRISLVSGEVDKNDLSADDGCHEWGEIDGGLKCNGDNGKKIKILFQGKLKYASKSAETR